MKKQLLAFTALFSVCLGQNVFGQNGTCIPPVASDCVSAPKYIDSVWTTGANIDFTNWGTGCNTQDQNYADYFTSRRAYVYYPGTFDLHISVNPVAVEYLGVWIDWNGDLVFGSGEQVYLSLVLSSSVVITIPYPNINDTVVMRVRTGTTLAGACDSIDAGETEDYGLVVFPGVSGIVPHPTNFSWTAYPNPATDFLTVELNGLNDAAEISVEDLLGNVVSRSAAANGKTQIDVFSLAHGMYFVRVKSGENVFVKKIIH
jgi:hypothetical protein